MAGPNPDDPQGGYIIQIPGVQDIISVPPLENEALKRERLTRWRLNSSFSTIPEPLRWLPDLLNWFDDIQDFLAVALTLSIPILRRVPSRFLPYVGWALLANDVLNFFTWTLGAPLNPRTRKVDFLRSARKATAGRVALVDAATAFLLPGRAKFIPFALTAGQVLYSFTGWGLRLGSLMGFLSDTFWAAFRLAQGQNVVIAAPPENDVLSKAARCIFRAYSFQAMAEVASPEEISIALVAMNTACGVLGAPGLPTLDDARLSEAADMQTPRFRPWSPSTIAALSDWPIPDVDDWKPPVPTIENKPTYQRTIISTLADAPDIDEQMARKHRTKHIDWPDGYVSGEVAQWNWDVFGVGFNSVVPLNSPMERMFGFALELGIVPPWYAYPLDAKVKARFAALGGESNESSVYRGTVGGGTLGGDHFLFPIAYPPVSDRPDDQMIQWAALGLAMYCHRTLWIPTYSLVSETPPYIYEISDWKQTTGRRARPEDGATTYASGRPRYIPASYNEPMAQASLLMWGNIWVRYEAPPKDAPTGLPPRTCFPAIGSWPPLSGRAPEYPQIQQVLDAMPDRTKRPRNTGQRSSVGVPVFGRDWLDAFLLDQDARRTTGPKFPGIAEPERPFDSEPNPADELLHTGTRP